MKTVITFKERGRRRGSRLSQLNWIRTHVLSSVSQSFLPKDEQSFYLFETQDSFFHLPLIICFIKENGPRDKMFTIQCLRLRTFLKLTLRFWCTRDEQTERSRVMEISTAIYPLYANLSHLNSLVKLESRHTELQ